MYAATLAAQIRIIENLKWDAMRQIRERFSVECNTWEEAERFLEELGIWPLTEK